MCVRGRGSSRSVASASSAWTSGPLSSAAPRPKSCPTWTVQANGGTVHPLSAAGCTESTLPAQGREHVAQLEKGFKYNSFPPTSGPHNPQTALWNIYTEPVPFVNQVHNLEHGGIIVQYGDQVSPETVQQISDWYAQDPTALLVAPLPALGDRVALTAWTKLAICPGFDPAAASAFRDQFIFEGPEQFPANQLQPGM